MKQSDSFGQNSQTFENISIAECMLNETSIHVFVNLSNAL